VVRKKVNGAAVVDVYRWRSLIVRPAVGLRTGWHGAHLGVRMRSTRLAVFAALMLAAWAGGARAESAKSGLVDSGYTGDGNVALQSTMTTPSSRLRTLEWDAKKGRWGLKLDVEQHFQGDARWNDVEPGVFFRLTPRLHIGGGLSLSPSQTGQPTPITPPEVAPRVRLETTFKF